MEKQFQSVILSCDDDGNLLDVSEVEPKNTEAEPITRRSTPPTDTLRALKQDSFNCDLPIYYYVISFFDFNQNRQRAIQFNSLMDIPILDDITTVSGKFFMEAINATGLYLGYVADDKKYLWQFTSQDEADKKFAEIDVHSPYVNKFVIMASK